MVQWQNSRLPRGRPGFDSRTLHFSTLAIMQMAINEFCPEDLNRSRKCLQTGPSIPWSCSGNCLVCESFRRSGFKTRVTEMDSNRSRVDRFSLCSLVSVYQKLFKNGLNSQLLHNLRRSQLSIPQSFCTSPQWRKVLRGRSNTRHDCTKEVSTRVRKGTISGTKSKELRNSGDSHFKSGIFLSI